MWKAKWLVKLKKKKTQQRDILSLLCAYRVEWSAVIPVELQRGKFYIPFKNELSV